MQWNHALRYPIVTCHMVIALLWPLYISQPNAYTFSNRNPVNAQFRPVRKFDSNLLTATLFTWPNFHDLAVGDRTCINNHVQVSTVFKYCQVILIGAHTERVKAVSNYL